VAVLLVASVPHVPVLHTVGRTRAGAAQVTKDPTRDRPRYALDGGSSARRHGRSLDPQALEDRL